MFQNYQNVTKKYLFDILQDRYPTNAAIIDRITHYLATEQDVKDFLKLIVDSYDKGFTKAVNDYKSKLKELGYSVKITQSKEG